jgi:hypothetical protein
MRGLTWKTVLAFLDDIVVLGTSFRNHLINLKEALQRFRSYGLKLKPKYVYFLQKEIEFLGRIISGDTPAVSESDIEALTN